MSDFLIDKNSPFKRFERIRGGFVEFKEIYVSWGESPKIWICKGRADEPGVNQVIEHKGLRLKEVTAMVDKFRRAGYIYAGEVKKVIDSRYMAALCNHDPADLFSCLKDGYSPHAFVTEKGEKSCAMMVALHAGAAEGVGVLVDAGCNVDWFQKWDDKSGKCLSWSMPLIGELLRRDLLDSVKFNVAEVLLSRGSDPNKVDAIRLQKKWSLRKAIECGADPIEIAKLGYPPIHIVSSARIAGLLLDNRALIELRDDSGGTPLHVHCINNRFEVVELLLQRGAKVNSRNRDGDTPILLAARAGADSVIKLLLANGADLFAKNKDKNNALMELFTTRRSSAKEKAKIANCVNILLAAGLCASSRGGYFKRTALMEALHVGNTHAAKILIKAGADINAKDREGLTALMQSTDSAVIKRCQSLGAAVDVQNKIGETALMLALNRAPWARRASNGTYKRLVALIDAGADLQKIDCNHPRVLRMASIDDVILLLRAGVTPDATGGAALMARAVKEDSLPLALALIGNVAVQKSGIILSADWELDCRLLPQFLRKLLSAKPTVWRSLISTDPKIQGIIAEFSRDDGIRCDVLDDDDLPEVLRLGRWAGNRTASVELPGFWVACGHPAPRLKSNGKPLPHHAVDTIARILLGSTHDKPAPEVSEVTAACDAGSLAAFTWSVFVEWDAKGKKSTDGFFHALAFWGDDDAARRLASLLRDWPGVHKSPRAFLGLEILCTMGTDAALRAIQTIAAKTRYPKLRARAQALMGRLAVSRNLTSDQFEDRLVPTLDLSERGALAVSFGARHFEISTDEQLKPILKDAAGFVLKALPNPAGADDALLAAQAAAVWSEFKVSLKPVASLQLVRLEKAMLGTRRWLGGEFKRHVAGHPLLQKPARGLVWGIYKNESLKNTFVLDGNGGFIGPQGDPVVLVDSSQVGLPHPLFFRPDIEAWLNQFAARNQRQPFAQLVRKTFLTSEDVDGTHFGLNGLVVLSNSISGLSALGWEPYDDDGLFSCMRRRFGTVWASLDISPGVDIRRFNALSKQQTLHLHCHKLSPLEYSEMMRELLTLRP